MPTVEDGPVRCPECGRGWPAEPPPGPGLVIHMTRTPRGERLTDVLLAVVSVALLVWLVAASGWVLGWWGP